MLETGVASAEDIDKALRLGLNHPMGPFEMVDLVGLDTRLSILEYLHRTLGEKYRPSPLLTQYVKAGRLGLQTLVDACSTQAARLFGLYPKKGTIQVGSDADLVVYDPVFQGTFSRECSHSKVDYNAYEGWERRGRASVVTVRGQVQARDGEFVGTIGRGVFLKREPTH